MEKEINKIWAIIILLTVISVILIVWNFALTSTIKGMTDNTDLIKTVDYKLDNLFEYQVTLWLERHNLTEYSWINYIECGEYRNIPDKNIKRIAITDDYVVTNTLIDDKLYQVQHYKNKILECFDREGPVICRDIFCES